MTDPLHNWQYAAAGWLEPLDAYLADPGLTDVKTYDVKDFSSRTLAAGRWNCQPLEGVGGEGSLWALPIDYETYITAYRADIFQKNIS